MENIIDQFLYEYKKQNKIKKYRQLLYIGSVIIIIIIQLLFKLTDSYIWYISMFLIPVLALIIMYIIFALKLNTTSIIEMLNIIETYDRLLIEKLLKKYKLNNKKSMQNLLYVRGINYLSILSSRQKFGDVINKMLGIFVGIYTLFDFFIRINKNISTENIFSLIIIIMIYILVCNFQNA